MSTSFTMIGGEGPESYRQHSKYQSSSTIIDAVEHKYQQENNLEEIEFQVFFNDSSNNDFNTLFKTLPPARKYFATGVPASFFGRVFLGAVSMSEFLLTHSISYPKFPKKLKTAILMRGTRTYTAPDSQKKFSRTRLRWIAISSWIMSTNGVQMSETLNGMMIDCIGSSLNDIAKQTPSFDGLVKVTVGGIVASHFGQHVMEKTFEVVKTKTQECFLNLLMPNPKCNTLLCLKEFDLFQDHYIDVCFYLKVST
ncbi:putative SAM dependent carboxyl methyltransferase [Arabidopsis thaliana]